MKEFQVSSGFKSIMEHGDRDQQASLLKWWNKLKPLIWRLDDKLALKAARLTVDKAVSEAPNTVACKRGCSFCCYQQVVLTALEARELAPYVKPERMERLKRQKDWTIADYGYNPESKCVFLGDNGECEVYDKRPLVCRTVFTFDAKSCEARKDCLFWLSLAAEAAITLYWKLCKAHPMPELLPRYIKEKKSV